MRYRRLGKSGYKVSEVGFGAWAIGAAAADETGAMEVLHTAADAGVTFFDTAGGGGQSERLLARLRSERDEELVIAATVGAHDDGEGYDPDHLAAAIDRSRENLGTGRLDLVQLHCPTDVYYRPEVFAALDQFTHEGRMASWGVSVERVEEGLKAMEYPNCASVQVVFNMFRQRPATRLLDAAWETDTGVIARAPLASGLLGKDSRDATVADDDRIVIGGETLDGREVFGGVPLEVGLEALGRVRDRVPEGGTIAQFAIRWILMHQAVSTVVVGARTAEHIRESAGASLLAPFDDEVMDLVRLVYEEQIAPHVHHRW